MIYAYMVDGLPAREKNKVDPWDKLDNELRVREWTEPGAIPRVQKTAPRPVGAPAWWTDDEEASQSFMTSMRTG